MDNMTVEQEWFSQILGNSTKQGYSRGLAYFKEFLSFSVDKSK